MNITFKGITVQQARECISHFMKDPELLDVYKANIAMCIYDNRREDGRLNHQECNEVAEKLIKVLFG